MRRGSKAPVSRPIVVYDACVLYPAALRDTLVSVAVEELCLARWTDEIQEWIANLLHDRPDLKRVQLDRTRRLMDEAVPYGLIRGYERISDALELPDAKDRHVLAAAIWENDSFKLMSALEERRGRLRNPPLTSEQFLAKLERQGLPNLVQRLRENAALF